jgi:hypothetical protein
MSRVWLDCKFKREASEEDKKAYILCVCADALRHLLFQSNTIWPNLRKIKYKEWSCCGQLKDNIYRVYRLDDFHRFPMLRKVNMLQFSKLGLFLDFQTLFAINKQREDACVCLYLCLRGLVDKNVIKMICEYLKDWSEIEDPRMAQLQNLKEKSRRLKKKKTRN